MSDAPIYERLASGSSRDPIALRRRAAIVGNEQMTAPLTGRQKRAMQRLEKAKAELAAEILAEVGLHPYDIAAPEYRRIVYEDELR